MTHISVLRRRRVFVLTVSILAVSFLSPDHSTASEWPQSVVPVGVNIGYGGNSYVIGGEASYVRLIRGFGLGAYLDGIKTRDDMRSNLGFEFFMLMPGPPILAGVGFGPAVRRYDRKNQMGFSAEVFTYAYVFPYCRYSVFRDERIIEGGVLIKIPIMAD